MQNLGAHTHLQKAVAQLRQLHESHVEAEILLIEAISEVDGYVSDNADILHALQEKQAELQELKTLYDAKRAQHKNLYAICQQLSTTVQDDDVEMAIIDQYRQLPTLEALDNEIAAISARLDMMAEGNPGARIAFEKREQDIAATQAKLEHNAERLEATRQTIQEIREQWEPELDALVAQISDRFSHNFQQIGCAGQVGVYKDEDFDKWSIQIQVRFR